MSGGGSNPAHAPSRRLDELIFAAIHSRAGSSIVDIPTVLERVDSVERWLLTFEELDGGLRRLSSAGRIAEVDVGHYVSIGSRHPTRPYSGISQGGYEAAVTAYRAAFAVDGAQTGDMAVDGKTIIIAILEGEVAMDRRAVADSVAAALRQHDLERALVLRFPDRDEFVARE